MLRKASLAAAATLGILAVMAVPAQAQPGPRFHVEYRQVEGRERVFETHRAAHRFVEMKESEGFLVRVHRRGDDWVVHFRMPEWRMYREVFSPEYAHELAHRLREDGYQARVLRY